MIPVIRLHEIEGTPPSPASTRRRATARASLVLPIPPKPVSVTRRLSRSSSSTSATSRSRPTRSVIWLGRAPGSRPSPEAGPPPTRRPAPSGVDTLPVYRPPNPSGRARPTRCRCHPPGIRDQFEELSKGWPDAVWPAQDDDQGASHHSEGRRTMMTQTTTHPGSVPTAATGRSTQMRETQVRIATSLIREPETRPMSAGKARLVIAAGGMASSVGVRAW